MKTLGTKISEYRKMKGMTQDELAEKLNVSGQAVSKWENDLSIPDLPLLIELAKFFHVTLDELVLPEEKIQPVLLPAGERKDINQMFLRMTVDSVKGDRVRMNLPMSLVKAAAEIGLDISKVSGNSSHGFENIDLSAIIQLVENGMIGRLMEVDSAEGDHVEIYVE